LTGLAEPVPGYRRGMLARVLVAALVAAALLTGAAHAAPRYTSLGDSYTAGPLIPLPLPPLGCLKSSSNYPRLAQLRLRYAEFRDASCSGAETEDMTQPQNVTPGPNPPQFDALSADTQLVTITIGGNDIGFTSIAEDCVSASPFGSPCRDQYVQNGQDEISRRIAETAPKVAAVIQGIHERSPAARVLILNYSAILPHTGNRGCWPQIPIARGDVPWVREKQEELNAMLAEQAAANGAELVDVYEASRGHDACRVPGVRWVEPYIPANAAAPLHPNLLGMRGMAALVVARTSTSS
jgi:lysophospholipase L1-like esterase